VFDNICLEFERFGIELINFNIERISIPKEELSKFQGVLGRRMEISQISQVDVGESYTVMRTFDVLEKAAQNEGNIGQLLGAGLGFGVGLGAGVSVGQQMGNVMKTGNQDSNDVVSKLKMLKQLFESGLITKEEFEERKQRILESI